MKVSWYTIMTPFFFAVSGDGQVLRNFMLRIMRPTVEALGWKDEGPHSIRKLRSLVLMKAFEYGSVQVARIANSMFKEWMTNGLGVAADLKEIVFAAGVSLVVSRSSSSFGPNMSMPHFLRKRVHCWRACVKVEHQNLSKEFYNLALTEKF